MYRLFCRFQNLSPSPASRFTEKQEIIQEQGFFKFDKFWDKYAKFQAEKDTIKVRKIRWNGKPDYYYSSLKAWCKRNDIPTSSYEDSYE